MAVNNSKAAPSTQQRLVRVFVSSTFRDMMAERDELVKFTFPELRRRCRERHVEFVEVDLRWGITDEQKAEGSVLPICLAEIERCRPYFIGLLGERYGWVPENIDEEVAKTQPWLKEHKEKSVTELEILHGVLNNPEMKGLAFFYFRDPETSRQVEDGLKKELGYLSEPKASQAKLKALKGEIRDSGHPLHEGYPDTKALGRLVLENLWQVIDERFPKEEIPSALERERMEHEAFAEARGKVYIGREEYYKKLDEHVKGDGRPLVILGESGSGKSALVANWAKRHREAHPGDPMVTHFIGGTPDSADHVRILRRIMEEIKEKYPEEKEEIPSDPKELVETLPVWLAKASTRGKFILVLDALNQLEDRDSAPDLGWLPLYFPPNVRVILSTLPGRSLDALRRRGWPQTEVGPLEEAERIDLIIKYLERFSRALSREHLTAIANAPQTSNPLYLKALLDELRVFGKHEELPKRISHYLEAQGVDDLYEKVLERLEGDYERDRLGLVRDAMSLIWAARRGLSEKELLDLLGKDGQPLPALYWSPLYLAIEESLVSRSGLLNFFHDFLRKAVEDRYLYTDELKRAAHLRIADYFDAKELDDSKVDELPWQLRQAESWEKLKVCISNLEIFLRLSSETKQYELIGYWFALDKRFDVVETYATMLAEYEKTGPSQNQLLDVLHAVARIFFYYSKYEAAEPLFLREFAINESMSDQDNHIDTTPLHNLTESYREQGKYSEGVSVINRALEIEEKKFGPESKEVVWSLNILGLLYSETGKYNEAEAIYKRALTLSEKSLGLFHRYTGTLYHNLGHLYLDEDRYDEAEHCLSQSLIICKKVFGLANHFVAFPLALLGYIYNKLGRLTEAEAILTESLDILEKTIGVEHHHAASCYSYLAGLYENKNDYGRAETFLRQALAIKEKLFGPDHPNTAYILNDLGVLFYKRGDYDSAEPFYRRALAIREKALGLENPDTVTSLNNLAFLYTHNAAFDRANHLYNQIIDIYESLTRQGIVIPRRILLTAALSHNNLAFHTCVPAKNWREAESHYRQSIKLFKQLQNEIELANIELNLQTMLYLSGQQVDLIKAKESTKVLEEADDKRAEKGHKLLKELS